MISQRVLVIYFVKIIITEYKCGVNYICFDFQKKNGLLLGIQTLPKRLCLLSDGVICGPTFPLTCPPVLYVGARVPNSPPPVGSTKALATEPFASPLVLFLKENSAANPSGPGVFFVGLLLLHFHFSFIDLLTFL